ncbi:toprim domain-containing protein [Bacillus niameyensis]|uniref:hypothetical protein n=1 Tax=Bacillus niameyensis TaxID=1522308 RepID=UPI000783BBC5|nr:hypothetical protein [Bacillus niameyensis]
MNTKEFIERYICKVGETVDQISHNEWQIQKWTARTFKTLGNVLAAEHYDMLPTKELIKLKLKPNSRRSSLSLQKKIIDEALHKGWIIQEIRFKKDGRTPLSSVYRMGPGLYEYERLKEEEANSEDRELKQILKAEVVKLEGILPADFLNEIIEFANENADSESWGKERVRRFCHFLIGYLQLRREKSRIEFKEIGATYYKKVGGSKAFDSYRAFFITRMEKWQNAPVNELGIISIGSIVSVLFTGNLNGRFSCYSLGTVHATTDIAIVDEMFQTDARYLWLVENRAVLTRMAAEVDFLEKTQSFIIGVDGQIRGAHRKMIKQLCTNLSVQKIIIWVDYDKAGEIIARDIVQLVKGISYCIVGNQGNLFSSYEEYVKWSTNTQPAEQEMTLGGPEEWKKWIEK